MLAGSVNQAFLPVLPMPKNKQECLFHVRVCLGDFRNPSLACPPID
jgi:hypothetical protein